MSRYADRQQDADLRRLSRVKHTAAPVDSLIGPSLVAFFKNSVQKRHTKLGKIGECWAQLVPQLLNDHCSLESFNRGSLTVIVDSSSHLYQLKTLLLAGLQQQILAACSSTGLKKIVLKPGRWYEGGDNDGRKVQFK